MTASPGAGSLEQLLEGRSRRLRWLVLAVVLGCIAGLAAYVLTREFPARPGGLADDYRDFYAAGHLLAQGLSPYRLHLLQAAEQLALPYPGNNAVLDQFADPPLTAWLMVPLSGLPFWISYALFTVVGLAALLLTLTLLARDLGWRHTTTLAAAVVVSWIGLLGLLDGQFDALLFAAVAGSMLLAWHERPLAAGAVMGLILIKPTLLWPAPVFLCLALLPEAGRARRFALGFLAAALVWLGVSWTRLGPWWRELVQFSHSVAGHQPDLAGLPGLIPAAPRSWHLEAGLTSPATLALVALALVGMAVFGAWVLLSGDWRRVSPVGRICWAVGLPVALWLLVTPYAHPNDDLLLLPLFMLTVGRDARRVHGLGLGLSALVLALFLLIWPGRLLPWELGLALAVVLAPLLWQLRTDPRLTGFGAGTCLLCLALLPPVYAFHTLAVGLTPVAVLVLVVEGARTCWMEVGGAGTGPAYFQEPAPAGIARNPAGA